MAILTNEVKSNSTTQKMNTYYETKNKLEKLKFQVAEDIAKEIISDYWLLLDIPNELFKTVLKCLNTERNARQKRQKEM